MDGRKATLLVLSILFIESQAATVEREYFEQLNHAREAATIAKLRHDFEDLQAIRLACALEIQEKSIPLSCYEAIPLEQHWKQISAQKVAEKIAILDVHCQRAVRTLKLPPRSRDFRSASKVCREAIQEGQRIERYRRGPEGPELE